MGVSDLLNSRIPEEEDEAIKINREIKTHVQNLKKLQYNDVIQ